MAKKPPAKSGTPWKPGDPLTLDKAMQQGIPNRAIADRLERADDALVAPVNNNTNRLLKPTNHKPFSRQKKG